jgi:hypothetical protein
MRTGCPPVDGEEARRSIDAEYSAARRGVLSGGHDREGIDGEEINGEEITGM